MRIALYTDDPFILAPTALHCTNFDGGDSTASYLVASWQFKPRTDGVLEGAARAAVPGSFRCLLLLPSRRPDGGNGAMVAAFRPGAQIISSRARTTTTYCDLSFPAPPLPAGTWRNGTRTAGASLLFFVTPFYSSSGREARHVDDGS